MIPCDIANALDYDPDTGLFHWKVDQAICAPMGSRAGGTAKSGYVQIAFRGTKYYAHRIAWLIMTGREPFDQVDHKNRVRSDNRWANLREANQSQNNGNTASRGMLPKGTTIHKGTGKFQAQIRHDGKSHYLGLFDTVDEAHAAYAAAAKKFFGEFARVAA